MKNIKITLTKYIGLSFFALGFLSSCGDETNFSPNKEEVDATAAFVKFNNATIGPNGTNFMVNWYLNDIKTTSGAISTTLPLGVGPGGSYPAAINYAQVPSGSATMKVEIPATATVPASTVTTSTFVTEAQMNYSTFVVGASPTYSTYTLKDDLSVSLTDPTKAYVRFVNLISNSPAEGYDISILELNSNAVIFSGVKYLLGSEIFIPITAVADDSSVAYELQMRTVGTTTIVAKLAFTPRKGRVYTLFNKGYVGGLSNGAPSTTVNIPAITYFTNK
ncbi:DUF4397 domain-containing protein [Flavobacterium algicola]|uniref:DUF4397 domain-containing protein n=1 Tax=Flavobacterium algicola TaxID=556529 RepID=UPI001EFDB8A8|nr:DUF4397 domain-containing protein [Flavobacterium algicola]MCG9791835.1 DUF4397 domain-containing protein [Flavobacterium algicola]